MIVKILLWITIELYSFLFNLMDLLEDINWEFISNAFFL